MSNSNHDFDEHTWHAELEAARHRVRLWLREAPTSYLAAVERIDFGDRHSLVVGSALDAHLRLDSPDVKPRHAELTVAGDEFRIQALDEHASFTMNHTEVRQAVVGPSTLQVGRYTLRLSHQGFPAVVVFDPLRLNGSQSLEPSWWPPEASLRVPATLVQTDAPEEIVIQSTRGHRRRGLKLGFFHFDVRGVSQRLEATRLLEPGVEDTAVSVLFRDETTARGSYPVGRYLDPEQQADGTWVLDFNRAFNPACAFSPHYNCPLPPKANRLSVPIDAGEQSPRLS